MCLTITGELVLPGNEVAPSLTAIAVGLARRPRWAGQVNGPMCVLAHSLIVANLCPREYTIDGLLHDAAEAILGDIPTTWKTDADRAREADLMRRIYSSLKREWPLSAEADQAVKDADWLALRAEATLLIAPEIETVTTGAVPRIVRGESRLADLALSDTLAFVDLQRASQADWDGPQSYWVQGFVRLLSR